MPKLIAVWNPSREMWQQEKKKGSSSGQWVPFSATFPTSGMMRGGRLSALPLSALPTAENGSSSSPPLEMFHTPDTAPDAPNKGSNTRSKPAGLGNQVKELTDPLLRTPQAAVTEPKPGIKLEGRTPSDPQVGLADQIVALDEVPPAVQRARRTPKNQLELFPTPGARDGDRGPRSDDAIASGTGQPSLLDMGKILPDNPVLPTPRASDAKGVDNEAEWSRHSPGLSAMSYHLREDEKLLSTPQARDWKGVPGDTYNSHNLARDISKLPPAADEPDSMLPTPRATRGGSATETVQRLEDEPTPMLPTPQAYDGHAPKTAEMMERQSSRGYGPNLTDVVSNLLPTPVVTDATGARNSTAWRSNPDHGISIGDTLTDAMWKLAADQGEMELPTGPTQKRFVPQPDQADRIISLLEDVVALLRGQRP